MKKLLSALLLSACLLGCQHVGSDDTIAQKDGVFVHISHGEDDVHRVLMGLHMAAIMSDDRDVLVYFDISGVQVVLQESEDLTFSHFPSSHTQIQNLLDKGVTLMACPGCLKAAGKTPDDLMPGIQVADKEKFFNFTSGRIITIDY
ncbi:peroxiredoxin [candidate division KSB1 bacterium]|nr:DsrE family protein [candidate division KSB1 bacterium]RQV99794.1 MAG: peroxiredoxin [candidate division KSB1 bacterium]